MPLQPQTTKASITIKLKTLASAALYFNIAISSSRFIQRTKRQKKTFLHWPIINIGCGHSGGHHSLSRFFWLVYCILHTMKYFVPIRGKEGAAILIALRCHLMPLGFQTSLLRVIGNSLCLCYENPYRV